MNIEQLAHWIEVVTFFTLIVLLIAYKTKRFVLAIKEQKEQRINYYNTLERNEDLYFKLQDKKDKIKKLKKKLDKYKKTSR